MFIKVTNQADYSTNLLINIHKIVCIEEIRNYSVNYTKIILSNSNSYRVNESIVKIQELIKEIKDAE